MTDALLAGGKDPASEPFTDTYPIVRGSLNRTVAGLNVRSQQPHREVSDELQRL